MKQPYIKGETPRQRKIRLKHGRRERKRARGKVASSGNLTLHFDGGITFNPGGRATYGWVIRRGGKVIEEGSGVAMDGRGATNNIAEYVGLVMGLEAVSKYSEPVKVYGDSRIVINAVMYRKRPRKKSPHLRILYYDAVAWLDKIDTSFEWIPSDRNWYADNLCKRAKGYAIYHFEDLYSQPELI